MSIRPLFLTFLLGLFSLSNSYSQVVDISGMKCNYKTFLFSDGETSLKAYINSVIEQKTTCCGSDGIYLEVVFDNSGTVTRSKTLTGKNDCFKKASKDIIKEVKWDATGIPGTKTVYFEIKPVIPCSGDPKENIYTTLELTSGVVSSNEPGDMDTPASEEIKEVIVPKVDPPADEEIIVKNPDPVVKETVKEEIAAVKEVVTKPKTTTPPVVKESTSTKGKETYSDTGDEFSTLYDDGAEETTKPSKAVSSSNSPKNYKSKGDRSPDASHKETWKNIAIEGVSSPTFTEGDAGISVFLKKKLQEAGVCGFAQALLEFTIDPQGNVVESVILKANEEKVSVALDPILGNIKFTSKPIRFHYRSYVELKTEIVCGEKEESKKSELDKMPSYLIVK